MKVNTHKYFEMPVCRFLFTTLGSLIAGLAPLICLGAQTSDSPAFRILVQRATAARESGDIPTGIRLYREALAQNADWQAGWWYYGALLYDNSQFSLASAALQHLTKLNPRLGGAWALLGLSEYETGQFGGSFNDLQCARTLGTGSDPNLANIVDYHVAVLLNAQGTPEAANLILSSLLSKGIMSQDLQVALGLTLLRVPLLPSQIDPSKDALIHAAGTVAAAIDERQYDRATVGFESLIANFPKTSFVHYAYGTMLATQGKDAAAEAQFQDETEISPSSALPYAEWSFLEMKATHYGQAALLARKAVQLSPTSFIAHYVLGLSLLDTGQAKAALSELVRARDLAPQSPEIRYSLSRAYAELGQAALAKHEQAEFIRLKQLKREQQSGRHSGGPATVSQAPSGTQ
jgi:predicted Zn-dependent protease